MMNNSITTLMKNARRSQGIRFAEIHHINRLMIREIGK
jgi:hypothetical protein